MSDSEVIHLVIFLVPMIVALRLSLHISALEQQALTKEDLKPLKKAVQELVDINAQLRRERR